MKNWYQSKTIGIIATQTLMAVVGYLNGVLDIKAMIAATIVGAVMALNRIYGTSSEIVKPVSQK